MNFFRGRAQRAKFLAGHTFQSNLGQFARNNTRFSSANASRIEARIKAQCSCSWHPVAMCTRGCPLRRPRTRRSLRRRPFRCCRLRRRPFRRRLPCCRLCRLCRRLAPSRAMLGTSTHPRPGSRRPRLLSRLGLAWLSAGGSAWLARLGSARLARLGTAQHGSAGRTARLAAAGQARRQCHQL